MEFKDYYQVLGVGRDAGADEIKRSYRKLARKYHPDVSSEDDAEARFKELQEAYEVLKDPEKRAAYDRLGSDWRAGEGFRPPPDWEPDFGFSGGGYSHAGGAGFSDFFEELFGARAGGGRRRAQGFSEGFSQGFSMAGDDHQARIRVPLEDLFGGVRRQITLRLPEIDGSGHLRERERTLNVRIPKGMRPGQRIRLAGQGASGLGQGPAGDLYLEVDAEPHRLFRLDGADLHLVLPVTPWEAALGATVKVPTLGGTVDLKIPPGSQSGRRLRLKGRGLPGRPDGQSAGDQYVELSVRVPPADSDAARAFYERMARELPMDPRRELEAGA